MFWGCSFLSLLWDWVEHIGGRILGKPFSLTASCVLYGEGLDNGRDYLLLWYIICSVKWLSWVSRCETLFEKSKSDPNQLLLRVKGAVRARVRAEFLRLDLDSFRATWCVRGVICVVINGRLVLKI